MKKTEFGFTVVEVLLLLLVISVIGFGGYYVQQNNKDKNSKTNTNSSLTSETPTGSTTKSSPVAPAVADTSYMVQFDKFSFNYTQGWVVKDSDKENIIVDGPNSFRLTFTKAGGLGGYCDPDCVSHNIDNKTLATFDYYNKPLYAVMSGLKDNSIYGNKVTVFKVVPEQFPCYYSICYGYTGKVNGGNVIISGAFVDKNGDPTFVEPSQFMASSEVQAALKILKSIKY